MHALWELVIDPTLARLDAASLQDVVDCLIEGDCEVFYFCELSKFPSLCDAKVAKYASAVVWGLARLGNYRRIVTSAGAVPALVRLAQLSIASDAPDAARELQVCNRSPNDSSQ